MDLKNQFTVVDLFAGCGGLSLGLEQANFHPIYVNELNDHARGTYLRNRESLNPRLERFHSSNIREMLAGDYLPKLQVEFEREYGVGSREIDLIVGGPPCQGFSGIGHRRSYAVDKRDMPSNHLYRDMAQVIQLLQPRAFLFENVKGLLAARWTAGGEKIWPDVLHTFESLDDYDVAYSLVYAKDYGVPQNRPRVLLVGIRKDVDSPLLKRGMQYNPMAGDAIARGFLPAGAPGRYPHPEEVLGDLLVVPHENGGKTIEYPTQPLNDLQRWFRTPRGKKGPLGANMPVSGHKYSKHSERVVAKFEGMLKDGVVPEEYKTKKFAQRLLPARWDEKKGPTITATSLPDDYVHYAAPRTLTVREWARLQMFPDWYEFEGPRTTGGLRRAGNPLAGVFERDLPHYTQIGNAVPVALARAVGEHLAKILVAPERATG